MAEQHLDAGEGADLALEIAHLLFIDVVGYSKLLVNEQIELMQELNRIVRGTDSFRDAEANEKLIRLPTGDGMVLLFFRNPEQPVRCALQISEALRDHPEIQLRMGIHSGPVNQVVDVNDQINMAGAGINIGQRVMDCGDAGHILLSKHIAEDLSHYRHWQPHLYDLGECEVKHGVRLHLVNLHKDGLGNATSPEKLRHRKRWKQVSHVGVNPVNAPHWSNSLLIGTLLLSALALVISFSIFFRRGANTPDGSVPALPIEKGIAVLPFQNLSDDNANAYLAGGIQDDLLVNLSKIGDLKVISRTSVQQYKDKPQNVREIGQALGVTDVLEGSVRRVGDRVRVTVQLINTANDEHIWAEDYDRDATDVFALQTDLALQIASILQTKLSPNDKVRLEERPTKNGEAYLIYLQAQDGLTRAESNYGLEQIAQLYEKAIQLDPTFALAFARLSDVECTIYQATGNHASLQKARAAANEAIRLRPSLPEAHLALGYLSYRGDGDYELALKELAIAKTGLPNDPDIFLVIGSIERRQGKWAQSTAHLEKATSVNPKNAFLWANLGINYQSVHNFSAAAKAFDRGIEADRSFFVNQCLRARLDIVWKGDTRAMERLLIENRESPDPEGKVTLARFQLKRFQRKFDEAIGILSKSTVDSFSEWSVGLIFPKQFLLAEVYGRINERAKAHLCLEESRQMLENAVRESPLDASRHALLGQIYAGLGRTDEAIREGKRAVELLPESKDALDGPVMTLIMAQIYAMVGHLDSALPLLEHSLATPGGITVSLLKLDPSWDMLRSDPRFQKVIKSFSLKETKL